MNIANPTVLLLLFPTALETKSKFLGRACKALHGRVLCTSSCLPTPSILVFLQSSRSVHRLCVECCSPPTSACSSFQTQSKGHWCSLTHSPLHPPSRTEQDLFRDSSEPCSDFHHSNLFWLNAPNYWLVCLSD